MSLAKRPKLEIVNAGAKPLKLSNNHLLDFPNKIILNFFDYLDDCTLLKAARVCRRFKEIAGLAVAKKYNGKSQGKYYELEEYVGDGNGDGRQEKLQHLPFLQTFCGKIDAVRVLVYSRHIQRSHWTIDAIEKYCSSVSRLFFQKSPTPKSHYTIDLADILPNLSKLTELYLNNIEMSNAQWMNYHYSSLLLLHIWDGKNFNNGMLKRFFEKNKQLETFSFGHTEITIDAFDQSNLVRILLPSSRRSKTTMKGQLKCVSMENLIQITIPNEMNGEIIEAIAKGCKNIIFFKILDLNDSIVISDIQVDAICSLQRISTLEIAGVKLTVEQVTKLISKLRNMTQFEYQSHYDTLEEYQSIIAATKRHPSLSTMRINVPKISAAFTVNADFHKFFIASAKYGLKLILWDSFEITNAKITKSGKLMYLRDFGLRKAPIAKTNMLQLTDKCFVNLFGELDTEHLWALYRTCNKLQKLLEIYFQEKFNEGQFRFRAQESLDIIEHFGMHISHVSVEVKKITSLDAAKIWDAIYKNCGLHLTELVIMGSCIPFDFKYVIDNQFVFPALQKLKFDGLNRIAINALTSKHSFCPNLQWLEFGNEQSDDEFQLDVNLYFGSNLNNLTTLRFWRYNDYVLNILNALNADARNNLRDLVLSNIIERGEHYQYRYQLNNTIVNTIVRFSKLTSLKLILSSIHQANMKYFFENCSKLEDVTLLSNLRLGIDAIKVLNSCVNVRKVQCVAPDRFNDKHFQEFVQSSFPRIETSTHDIKSWNGLHH